MIRFSLFVSLAWPFLFFLTLPPTGLTFGQTQEALPQTPTATVSDKDRSTINSSAHSVWYDSSDGTVHPIRRSKSIDVDDRHDSIAGNTKASGSRWWRDFSQSWSDFFSLLFRSWQILLIACSLGILTLIGFLFFGTD